MQPRSARLAVVAVRKQFEDTLAGLVEVLDEDDICYSIRYERAREQAARQAAGHLPLLDSRQGASEYIACVAWLASHGHITKEETKTLLYAAQTALQALPAPTRATKPAQKVEKKNNASKQK